MILMKKKKDDGLRFFWEAEPPVSNIQERSAGIADKRDSFIVRAEFPGFKKNEISLNITASSVEIYAARKRERTEKGRHFFRQELSAGAVSRAFALPERVDAGSADARLED